MLYNNNDRRYKLENYSVLNSSLSFLERFKTFHGHKKPVKSMFITAYRNKGRNYKTSGRNRQINERH